MSHQESSVHGPTPIVDTSAVLSPPEVRFTRSGSQNLAYVTYGTGPLDIVFVSPLMSHVEVMVEPPQLAQIWSRLSSLGRLILFDRRGAGLSDPAPGFDGASLDAWSDDLECVLAAVGAGEVCLFTFDTGAPYSLVFSASHPERVRSVALVEPFAPNSGRVSGGTKVAEFTARTMAEAWGEGVVTHTLSPALDADPPSAAWWARFERMSMSRGTFEQALRDFLCMDVRSAVPLVQAPVLVAYSPEREFLGATSGGGTSSGRWLAENLPSSETLEVAHGDQHWWWQPDLRAVMLDAVAVHFTGQQASFDADRLLATVLFTDLVRSTEAAVAARDRRWQEILDEHDALVLRELKLHRGELVKTTGDGILAVFDAPVRAIRCAQEIKKRLVQLHLEVRAGVHTGEIERRAGDLAGVAVHLTARVMSTAEAGQIVVSRTVRDLVVGSGLTFSDRGEYQLKGFPEPWQLFTVEG
jgi:class 3 adenylate cyclase